MTIYHVGKIKRKDWEPQDFVALVGKKEIHSYFRVGNTDTDEIIIQDTCGRYIPIDRENLSHLISVLLQLEAN